MRLRFYKCSIHPEFRGEHFVWREHPDCLCPFIYRAQNPFGSPVTNQGAGDKHAIYLWRQNGSWRFLEAFDDDFDAIVDEEWLRAIYSTTELNRTAMLEALARRIGLE